MIDTDQRGAGRPRDPRIERAALTAARSLILEKGYPGVTMAAIAARGGTTKAALYRRWPSLPHVVYEAAFPADLALDLRLGKELWADLRGVLTGIRDLFTAPVVAAALPGLLAEFSAHPQLHSALLARFSVVFDALDERFHEGASTGECRPDASAEDTLRLAIGAVLMGLLLDPGSLDEQWADRLATTFWRGLRP